jgi:hypothetical protein
MKLVVADNRIDKKCETALTERGFELVKLPPFSSLQEPVSAHPDMLFFAAKGRLVCHRDYFSVSEREMLRIANASGLSLDLSDEAVGTEYPRDVLFNAAAIGDKLICRRDTLSEKVAELYSEDKIINVKQGYAKCSVCAVNDNAIITADRSIAKEAEKNGIDVLLISQSGVRLDGYDCGFIGGASGCDGEKVYFCGNIDLHPDGERIRAFCERQGRKAISLSDEPLYDYGTLIFI